ncbi:7-deoxyloganetin glucosyltransferase-like [Silene latifolia]|uniref:7-deoxyloganetin glucosyltransferase-like n=1 Tax=Silene latifolia TaxID=37657 RepID=UPI003D76C6B4
MSKLHVVMVPFPAQSHIKAMLKLAKILNSKGLHITFVNTEHNHRCLLNSWGPDSLVGTPSFRFETFPDGLPPTDTQAPRPTRQLVPALEYKCREPFLKLLIKINEPSSGSPPITLLISDALIPFALDVAKDLGDCPVAFFAPISAFSYLAYSQFDTLRDRGIVPFQDPNFMIDGTLDMELDMVPPSMSGMRLKDLPSHIRTMNKNNPIFDYMKRLIARCSMGPIIFNTFEALDQEILRDLSFVIPTPVYTIGPLGSLLKNSLKLNDNEGSILESTFWKEDSQCLDWLNSQNPNSVVYVSFGSTTTMSSEQLIEFAWGLANSNHPFLWVVRPDIIIGESTVLPVEFKNEVSGRGLLVNWSPQEEVLDHPSVAVFLTHSGWNSTIESISSGVPVICWPFLGDQQPNSWLCCNKWGIGIQLNIIVERAEVEEKIRKVMMEEEGKEMKKKSMELKRLADIATSIGGSSNMEVDRLINYVASLNQEKA